MHIGHSNIIAYSGRPFVDVPDMNERIVTAWNETVGPDDYVYILGDLCMGKLDDSLSVAGQLQGHKILVPGNHDRCHPKFVGKKGDPLGAVATMRRRVSARSSTPDSHRCRPPPCRQDVPLPVQRGPHRRG